jgi:ABC-type polysaccharide/polyol phosphate transport system ATPase subunit
MTSIRLDDVSLAFRVRERRRMTFKEFFLQHKLRHADNPLVEVRALRNVTLNLGEGERIGIVGHNGAGKSTLLKLIAGIYPPSSGNIRIDGKVSSMLDLGAGIEGEASGWDNIAYRCYLQGDQPADVRAKREAIAAFTELGDALHRPVRYYSDGMRVRLLFAIATSVEPQILLLDEILGAGDMAFQEKARQRMDDLMNKARLILLTSHDLRSLRRLCSRVVWLHRGQVVRDGAPADVIGQYQEHMRKGCPEVVEEALAAAC